MVREVRIPKRNFIVDVLRVKNEKKKRTVGTSPLIRITVYADRVGNSQKIDNLQFSRNSHPYYIIISNPLVEECGSLESGVQV